MNYGCQSEVGKVDRLLLKHPKEAFIGQENIDAHWKELNYSGPPDYEKAIEEYEGFFELLKKHVSEINFLPRNDNTSLDSIYVHDPAVITSNGVILCNMGKEQRQQEPSAMGDFLPELYVPILGSISGEGKLEGGDVVWMDERVLVVGRGYRTNDEGFQQLKQLTAGLVDELVVVPLPHWDGPEGVLHLMSLISPIDYNLALVYSRLLPVPFRDWLLDKGVKLLDVPDSEFETMACNVLAVAPRKCIMLSGNPLTRKILEDENVEVWEYEGKEISLKGAGGPTCLTRPILRL
jgi:arginine deiminase